MREFYDQLTLTCTLLGETISVDNISDYKLLRLMTTNLEIYIYLYASRMTLIAFFDDSRAILGLSYTDKHFEVTAIIQDILAMYHAPTDVTSLSNTWTIDRMNK